MKKPVVIIGIILAVVGLGAAAYYWQNLRGASPAILPPPRDIAKALEKGKAAPGGVPTDAVAFP